MPTLEDVHANVNAAKRTAKKKKVLSEKQKAVLENNKFRKGEERTVKAAIKGGTAKGESYRMLLELLEASQEHGNVQAIFSDLNAGRFQNALARLAVLKQCGIEFAQTDEGKTQKMELDTRLSGGVDITVTGLD